MQALYSRQSANIWKTWTLMTFFLVIIIVLGFIVSTYYGNSQILYVAIFFSLLLNVGAYWFSDSVVLSMAGARAIEKRDDYPELWSVVENLSETANLPMPKLYIINDPAPNAFATGRNKYHAAIAVTTGILPLLSKSELEGVIAHELSHIGNRDMLLQSAVVVFAGIISFVANMALQASMWGGRENERKSLLFFVLYFLAIILTPIAATIVRLAISREREYLADATGSLITKYPEGLATALQKISNFHQPMKLHQPAIAHLFISDPTGLNGHEERVSRKVSWLEKLFMTHPPTEDRIARLLNKTPM